MQITANLVKVTQQIKDASQVACRQCSKLPSVDSNNNILLYIGKSKITIQKGHRKLAIGVCFSIKIFLS